MSSFIKTYFFKLTESYLVISLLAIAVGFLWPQTFNFFNIYSTILLQIIFFLSSIRIDLDKVKDGLKDWKALLLANVFMLVLLPIGVYFIARIVAPSITIPLVLLAAMPTAMSAPLFVEIVKGNSAYALVLTVTTSILAPITVPLVIKFLLGSVVAIDVLSLFWSLVKVIIIPFVIAQLYRIYLDKKMHLTQKSFKGLSIVLLGLLIAGIIAHNAPSLFGIGMAQVVFYGIAMFVFYILLHIFGYNIVYWRSNQDRMTIAVCLTYMNFVLSLYIAGKYFNQPSVILPLIVSIVPWTILLVPYQKFLHSMHKI